MSFTGGLSDPVFDRGLSEFPLVYVGRGGAQDYAGRDVRGCLVLVDINQRDEWWINFPVYRPI